VRVAKREVRDLRLGHTLTWQSRFDIAELWSSWLDRRILWEGAD
jgi:hypothetical protein